jgi:hypothetical protein
VQPYINSKDISLPDIVVWYRLPSFFCGTLNAIKAFRSDFCNREALNQNPGGDRNATDNPDHRFVLVAALTDSLGRIHKLSRW